MPNYEHDIFLSYRRSDRQWVKWTRENLCGALETLLRPGLGKVSIFVDQHIEVGNSWPQHLALKLSRSRLLIPVLSRDYFQSSWCRLELALMYRRELDNNFRSATNPSGLIVPIVIDDGISFPPEIQAIQGEPFHDFANPFIRMDSP